MSEVQYLVVLCGVRRLGAGADAQLVGSGKSTCTHMGVSANPVATQVEATWPEVRALAGGAHRRHGSAAIRTSCARGSVLRRVHAKHWPLENTC